MKTWTEYPGYPVLTINMEPNSITITQNRFFLRNLNSIPDNCTWSIPLTGVTSKKTTNSTNNKVPVYWLTNKTDVINFDTIGYDWIIFNAHSSGNEI